MIVITPHIDPVKQIPTGPTSFMTERNEREVRCGMCARPIYVNEETFQAGNAALESGLDDPFRCEICAVEYTDL